MKLAHIFLKTSILLLLFSCGQVRKKTEPIYLNETASIDARIEDVISRLTVEEKVAMLHARSKFSSSGVPRLGIPDVWCTDGPHGIRPEVLWDEWDQAGWTNDSCTAFPALTCLAATWNPELSALYGKSIGEEAKYRKKDVLLGPGVNICRVPMNGRNFEYMGEDPFLASKMVVPYVKGVQANGVAACVKHFALNNQELHRLDVNVMVDDRTLYEIYLPAFKAAVQEGGAWAVMGSYNMYNGQFNSHNKKLLNDILKKEWGFDGVVISDWGGARYDDESITNGLDMEFGTWEGLNTLVDAKYDNYHLATPYLKKIKEGKVGTTELDDKVRRILRLIFRTSMSPEHKFGRFTCPEHYEAARKIGAEGIVLLKNDNNILPINSKVKKILVVGENAVKMMTVGGGSSSLKVEHEISPLDGLKSRFGNQIEIIWNRGYVGDSSGQFNGVETGQDLSESRSFEELLAEAVESAKKADMVIFIGGLNKSEHQDAEGADRLQLELPYRQGELIEALSSANKNLVVVNISGSPVSMPWANKVAGIVQDWYIGSEAGNSLADVLSGDVNPSGKLPFTIPFSINDIPVRTAIQYPGIKRDSVDIWDEHYDEGILVGYRWYDAKNIKPQFPFGYGLSYTKFDYSDMRVKKQGEKIRISLNVSNVGKRSGSEIVQIYVSAPKSITPMSVKELKGFKKIFIDAGKSKNIDLVIDKKDLRFFDTDKHDWVLLPGEYIVYAASSASDLRLSSKFELK